MSAMLASALWRTSKPGMVTLTSGDVLFRRDDVVSFFFVVRSGCVRLSRVLATGTEITLARISDGGIIAEASLYSHRYHCDAIAEAVSILDRFSARDARTLLERDANVASAYAAHLARQVMDARALAEIRGIRRADERLLAWLELRSTDRAFDGQGRWPGIAREVGLTQEAVYRALAQLERSNKIARNEGRVTLK